ncbi:MAG: flagellar basal-body MS-ring/collar protein FliF [Pseudomonadota bacterium]
MAEASASSLVAKFNGYSRQPFTRQLALLLGLAASAALAIGLVQWAMEPQHKPLFGAMAPEDTNAVIATLDANGIEYSLERRTGMLTVPASDMHRARLALAGAGYPRQDGIGFESLYREQEIGLSSFMEQARYHRALEAELSRTITAMESVRSARVHLAMTKQSAFLRQRERPAASVMLNLYAGRPLNDRQLSGIVHLVASSVPNLDAEQVSVVDQQGKLLSTRGSEPDFEFSQEQFRVTRQLEQDYSQRILNILEPILGPGSVRAQVAADLDFTRIERTSEVYAPDPRIRSEQTSEETSNQRLAGGVPGALASEPPVDSGASVQASADDATASSTQAVASSPARTSRRSTINYEMDKTISHVRETPGTLRSLSIAVLVDYETTTAEDGTVSRAPLSAERIDEVTTLVQEAVGFNATRGDSVSVISASFVDAPTPEDIPLETSLLDEDWVWQLARGLLALTVLLTLVFFVIRPVMQFSAVPVAPPPQALPGTQMGLMTTGMGAEPGAMAEDQVTIGGTQSNAMASLPGALQVAPGYQQQLQLARSVASGEPVRAAHVVKSWMSDNG